MPEAAVPEAAVTGPARAEAFLRGAGVPGAKRSGVVEEDRAPRVDAALVDPATIGDGDVLVLRALGLGDALTGIAPLRAVRRAGWGRRLILAASAPIGSWLACLGVVDGVCPTRELDPLPAMRGGHAAVDLHGRGPASQRVLLATRPSRLVAFDCPQVGHAGPTWHRDEHEVDRWLRMVRAFGADGGREDLRLRPRPPRRGGRDVPAGRPVVVHPGAAFGSRRWPADRWRAVAGHLAPGRPVVVTGSAEEAGLCAAVASGVPGARDLAGRLGLRELTELVADAALVVCGDTGVAHLATALAVPSVVLFGPTPPGWWGPAIDPDLHAVLWHGDPSTGAWGDPHGEDLDPRLAAVTVEEVLAAADGHLGGAPPSPRDDAPLVPGPAVGSPERSTA